MSEQEKTLTDAQFSRLRWYQRKGCALCGKVANNLQIDHDHQTMLCRGLLCHDCNLLLAEYERQRSRLQMYEAYLRYPPMKALGMQIQYKDHKPRDKAS